MIQSMYQHKIYGSDKDFLGIVFFGTEKNNTGDDFLHIHMLQVLLFNFYPQNKNKHILKYQN